MAVHSCLVMCGNLPKLGETTEVIKTNVIAGLRSPAQPLNPPFVTARPHDIPVVKRIPPALPGRAKRIRRDAGNDLRIEILIQAIQFGMRPNVRAVVIHKNGNVTHYTDLFLRAIQTQSMPLLVKKELNNTASREFR